MSMTSSDNRRDGPDAGLERFFDAARATAPVPDPDWLARLQAEALELQPQRRAAAPRAVPSLWVQLRQVLGGWPGIAGLASVAVAGLWLGAVPPQALGDAVSTVLYGADSLSLDPLGGFDLALLEG